MKKPTLYKKQNINNVRNRTTEEPSSSEVTSINSTINKFFELFKLKHM